MSRDDWASWDDDGEIAWGFFQNIKNRQNKRMNPEDYFCPRCKTPLSRRTNHRNSTSFIGCDFPKCRFSCDDMNLETRALNRTDLIELGQGTLGEAFRSARVKQKETFAEQIHQRSLAKYNQSIGISTFDKPVEQSSENVSLKAKVAELEMEVSKLKKSNKKLLDQLMNRTPVDL